MKGKHINLANAERLETANKRHAELLAVHEKQQIEATLSGKTVAGEKKMTKDEKDIANAKKMLAGTGWENEIFPE